MPGRIGLFVALAAGLVWAGSLSAGDPQTDSKGAQPSKPLAAKPGKTSPTATVEKQPTPTTPANPLSRQRRQRRQQWEKALQSPADLVVDDTESITLGALLEQIRKKHGLNIQIDMAHVLPLASALELDVKKAGGNPRHGLQTAGLIPLFLRPAKSLMPAQAYSAPGYGAPAYGGQPVYDQPMLVPPMNGLPTYGQPVTGQLVYPATPSSVSTAYYPPAAANDATTNGNEVRRAKKPAEESRATAIKSAAASDDDEWLDDDPASEEASVEKKKDPEGLKGVNDEKAGSRKSDAEPSAKDEADESNVEEPNAHDSKAISKAIQKMLEMPVDAAIVARPDATLEDVVRHAFDRAFPMQAMLNSAISEEFPMLASFTQATEWDLLIQDHGVLITTRLNANLQKETRVYSTRAIEQSSKLKSEDVARVLTRTIRPWSWKRYFPEEEAETQAAAPAKQKTKAAKKVSMPKVNLDLLSLLLSSRSPGIQRIRLTSDEETSSSSESSSSDSENVELTEEQLELLGRAWDGLFQSAVTSLQVIYHGDPPTGVVEVLPGMLIISQSQGAHREIADLLEQLTHPEN